MRKWSGCWRLLLLAVIGGSGVLAGGAVSSALTDEANRLPSGFTRPTDADQRPKPETKRIAATAAHPSGGPAWGLEVSESETGAICQAVNRVADGRLVLVDDHENTHPRRPPEKEACSRFRAELGDKQHAMVGVVAQYGAIAWHGVVDDEAASVVLEHPDGSRTDVPLTAERAFLVVRAGKPDEALAYTLRVRLHDGTEIGYY